MTPSWRTAWLSMNPTAIGPGCRHRHTSRSAATPGWPQPALAAPQPKNRRAALSHRPACAVQQQPGGTGRADDEIAPEDLRRLPLHGGGDGFCRDPLAAFNSQEAGLGSPANLERQPGQSDRKPQGCVTRPRPGLLPVFDTAVIGSSGYGTAEVAEWGSDKSNSR